MTFDAQIIHWRTLAEFTAYLHGVPRPAWVKRLTNHNTYVPNERDWRGLASMNGMLRYYRDTKQWSAGPHLYLCADAPNPQDTGIWQMTPITHPGIHAGPCNADALGLESVGDFDRRPPSASQYTLLLAVNRAILAHWGMPPSAVNVHNECMAGRTCPGKYLTGTMIRTALEADWPRTKPVVTPDSTLLHSPRATPEQCIRYILARPHGEYTEWDVALIVRAYFEKSGGVDPLLAISQMIHETGNLASYWAARPRRNPAGIGVTGAPGVGLAFASWANHAVPAHVGRLLAYALPPKAGTPAQRELIADALALRPLPASYRGAATTLQGLEGRWAVPGVGYADKIAAIANQIRGV